MTRRSTPRRSGTGASGGEGTRTSPVSWHWPFFLLGLAYALPAIIVIPFSMQAGLALAVGVLPVSAFNLPPRRPGRRIIPLVGILSAASFLVGSLLTQVPVIAVVGIFLLAVTFAMWARTSRAGTIALTLCLPLIGIALSYPDLRLAAVLAALVLAGSVYAWGVATLWPEHTIAAPVPSGPAPTRAEMGLYGVLLGCAAATAAAVGYLLGLEHVGWATGAALLVMRPVRDQLILRSIGRAASVLAGSLVAASFALLEPSGLVTALVIGFVLAAMSATQASRWYIAPGFTSFIALTLLLQDADAQPALRFVERAVETGLGVGVALFFGAVVPLLIRVTSQSRRSA